MSTNDINNTNNNRATQNKTNGPNKRTWISNKLGLPGGHPLDTSEITHSLGAGKKGTNLFSTFTHPLVVGSILPLPTLPPGSQQGCLTTLSVQEQTTIFRLRTGHCGLRAHLKRTGIMDSALCDCKEAEQTVHHILQDCSIWRKQRHQLWPQDESTTNKLWGTEEVLRLITQFLVTCGLRV